MNRVIEESDVSAMLEVKDVEKSFEGRPLLKKVAFQVGPGETICLLGPSGGGKSTLLRILAGLEQPEAGRVLWGGSDLANVPAHRRGFGLMFQDYALFPHRSVAENVAFGLRMQGLPRQEVERRVAEALEQVHMDAFARRRVTDLSGGEQQRIALARTLAPRPRLVMLDEPLGALDRTLREQLIQELRRILHETRLPAIYVTHDQEEAFTIADRILLLHEGRIVQSGAPAQVYNHPASPWVARFFGLDNLVSGKVVQRQPLQVETPLGLFRPCCEHSEHALGAQATLLLNPSRVRQAGAGEAGPNCVQGVVEDVVFRGESFRVSLRASGGQALRFFSERSLQPGQQVSLVWEDGAVLCLG